MPPSLALVLAGLFILYLLWRDSRLQPKPSSAVWIPCIWLMILGSRSVSEWLNPGTFQSANDLVEGSPTDRVVYLGMLAAGCIVLWKRRIPLRRLLQENVWLTAFYLYCGVSILWSDFPFVAFKRWIKGLGDPLIALILLSDHEPARAVETAMKRCAYILIPLSIVFIKYYPSLGRSYSEWTGAAYYTGVTTNKSLLGYLLLAFGLFFFSTLLGKTSIDRNSGDKTDCVIAIVFLLMITWLFWMADSKTPLITFLAASSVVIALRFAAWRKHFGAFLVASALLCATLQLSFNVIEDLIASSGRDTTLTGRTDLWESVLSMKTNPWLGAGFDSFWLGERLKKLWAEYYFKPTQAHNGYLEIYLNLGLIGLCLLGGILWASYRKLQKNLTLRVDSKHAKTGGRVVETFGLAYLAAYVIYNVTEATIHALNFLFVIFLVIAIEYPMKSRRHRARRRGGPASATTQGAAAGSSPAPSTNFLLRRSSQ
jgi:O-antigen ligase